MVGHLTGVSVVVRTIRLWISGVRPPGRISSSVVRKQMKAGFDFLIILRLVGSSPVVTMAGARVKPDQDLSRMSVVSPIPRLSLEKYGSISLVIDCACDELLGGGGLCGVGGDNLGVGIEELREDGDDGVGAVVADGLGRGSGLWGGGQHWRSCTRRCCTTGTQD